MGFLSWLGLRPRNPTNELGLGATALFTGPTSSGKTVTERSAMQMSAVYACVRILAEAIASLPLHMHRSLSGGGKERATDHPLYRVLHDEPNAEMKSFVLRETLMTHLLLWGNAYAQVIRNGLGDVIGLYTLMPPQMSVARDPKTRELVYSYQPSPDSPITGPVTLLAPTPSLVSKVEFRQPLVPGFGYKGLSAVQAPLGPCFTW